MSEEKKNDVTIVREFDAPLQLVWKAWTDPDIMKKWWGPKDWSAPTIQIDFREGGKYLSCMRGQMGPGMPEVDTWSTGTYKEIVPMKKIVVTDSFADPEGNVVPASYYGMPGTFPMEATIQITFEDLGGPNVSAGTGRTKMTLYYPSIAGIEGEMLGNMTAGWNQSFDKLEEIVQ